MLLHEFHLLSEIGSQTHIFNLDTGYQFPETLELREEIARRYGIEVIERAKGCSPDTEAIVLTGKSSLDSAVAALRFGAHCLSRLVLDEKETTTIIIINR